MEKTLGFFNSYLPHKFNKYPEIAAEINGVYQFNIAGAGTWIVDLTDGGSITEGTHDNAGCVVETTVENFEKVLNSPTSAMMMIATGKLKISNVGMGMALQKLF